MKRKSLRKFEKILFRLNLGLLVLCFQRNSMIFFPYRKKMQCQWAFSPLGKKSNCWSRIAIHVGFFKLKTINSKTPTHKKHEIFISPLVFRAFILSHWLKILSGNVLWSVVRISFPVGIVYLKEGNFLFISFIRVL